MAWRAAVAALLPLLLPGCAGRMPAPAPAPAVAAPAPAPAAPAPSPAPPTSAGGPRRFVPADSLPSREALDVLATIPEPVNGAAPPSNAVVAPAPRPAPVPAPPSMPVPRPATPPSPQASAPQVATPASERAVRDTLARAAPPPATGRSPVVLPPPPSPPPPPPPPPDTCWRVQFAAPSERVRAEALRDAAQSLLVTPVVIELEASRWKVRTRDCLARLAAESLRRRALDSGLAGAFLVRSALP
jgi:hypothetical protein